MTRIGIRWTKKTKMNSSIKPPKLGSTLGKTPGQPTDISKVGKQGVSAKMPKMKKPGDAFSSPSQFFKSENQEPKHPNLKKMWNFINKKYKV